MAMNAMYLPMFILDGMYISSSWRLSVIGVDISRKVVVRAKELRFVESKQPCVFACIANLALIFFSILFVVFGIVYCEFQNTSALVLTLKPCLM